MNICNKNVFKVLLLSVWIIAFPASCQELKLYKYDGCVSFATDCSENGTFDSLESAMRKNPQDVIAIQIEEGRTLSNIPPAIKMYQQLRYLGILGSSIKLDDRDLRTLEGLVKLQYLNLANNKIGVITPEQGEALCKIGLRGLILNRNVIRKGLENIYKIKTLGELQISACGISNIPAGIENLKNLRSLHVSRNPIGSLPYKINEVPLEMLDISKCMMNGKCVTNLPKTLIYLEMSQNNLGVLPESVYEESGLKELFANKCNISNIDKGILRCSNLVGIALNENNITNLPVEFSKFKNLKIFQALDNPLRRSDAAIKAMIRNGVAVSY